MSGLRYLSVCSGIEAATVAWHPLGWVPVGFAEIEAFPSRVLAHHYGSNMPGEPLTRNGVPNFGDFTAINTAALGPVDLLVGGTPCQAFSVAGLRRSLADARGNLSLAYTVLAHALARSHGLRWSVWENVPGVLSTGDNAFGCFLGALVGGDDPVEPVARPRFGRSNSFWRWRKAGTELDDDGNEIAVQEGHVTRWPSAGMVAGPLCRAAWRVLDAQYFGLAQRRRRVFVVAGFGDGADPAAVLFEPQGLRRHPPTRGEAGEGVARPVASGSQRGSGYRNDADTAEILIAFQQGGSNVGVTGAVTNTLTKGNGNESGGVPCIAFGGNHTSGPIDIATAVNAHGGPNGRQDFESETFVVAGTLQASGRAAGSATHQDAISGLLVPIAFDCKAGGDAGFSVGDIPGAPRGEGHGGGHAAIAFHMTQITHPENRSNPQPGDPCHPLAAAGHVPAVAFDLRGREGGAQFEGPHDTANIRAASGGSSRSYVAHSYAVRRLMPVETERLQGFKDGYTAIPGAADGPRYKTHGNSMAVNVMGWIGERIAVADEMRSAA